MLMQIRKNHLPHPIKRIKNKEIKFAFFPNNFFDFIQTKNIVKISGTMDAILTTGTEYPKHKVKILAIK